MNSSRGAGNRLAAFLSVIVFALAVFAFVVGRGNPLAVALGALLILVAIFIPQSLMMASQ